MKIIEPITATDANIVANNIAGSTLAEWDVSTAYVQGDKVQVSANHREYECLINNTGKDPTGNPLDPSGNPYWYDTGATNDRRLFDSRSRSPSVNPLNITVSVKSMKITNGIALINIFADTLNVTAVSDSAGEVYNEDVMLRRYVNTFTDWFFSPIENITNAVQIDLPLYTDMTITITATVTSGDVSIGEFVFGAVRDIGLTQYSTSVGITDYSTKEVDEFGNIFIVERGYANKIDYDVIVLANRTDYVKRLLARYRATPLVYVGKEDKPETITYGYYTKFSEVLEDFANTSLVLSVEEII